MDSMGFTGFSPPRRNNKRPAGVLRPSIPIYGCSLGRRWIGMMALVVFGLMCSFVRADTPAHFSTSDLELQASALSTISDLELTPEQRDALKNMASDTAADEANVQTSNDPDYRAALQNYRDAAIGGDDQKISDASDRLDDIRDQQNVDPKIDIRITSAARAKAEAAVKLLSSSQIANYLAEHSDDVPDAGDTIIDAIDQCRDLSDADFESLKKEACEQVDLLVNGLNASGQKNVTEQVSNLLNKARKMTARTFNNREQNLEQQARKIGTVDAFVALRHWMEREMANLLSNPQITEVLSAQ
jgi:hypothetical protein